MAEDDGAATTGQPAAVSTVALNIPGRASQPGPSQVAFDAPTLDQQLTSEPIVATPAVEAETVADAPTDVASPSPAQRALADFYAYTDRNWSAQGYSSPDEMREALGNRTTGWLDKTSREASATKAAAPAEVVAASGPRSDGAGTDEAVATAPASTEGAEAASPSGDETVLAVTDDAPAVTADEPTVQQTSPRCRQTSPRRPEPVANQDRSLDSFYAYTEQNWSAQGYSSAEEMRRSLGSGWLERARQLTRRRATSHRAAGLLPGPGGPVLAPAAMLGDIAVGLLGQLAGIEDAVEHAAIFEDHGGLVEVGGLAGFRPAARPRR